MLKNKKFIILSLILAVVISACGASFIFLLKDEPVPPPSPPVVKKVFTWSKFDQVMFYPDKGSWLESGLMNQGSPEKWSVGFWSDNIPEGRLAVFFTILDKKNRQGMRLSKRSDGNLVLSGLILDKEGNQISTSWQFVSDYKLKGGSERPRFVLLNFDMLERKNEDILRLYIDGEWRKGWQRSKIPEKKNLAIGRKDVIWLIGSGEDRRGSDLAFGEFVYSDRLLLYPATIAKRNPAGDFIPKYYEGYYGRTGFYLDFRTPDHPEKRKGAADAKFVLHGSGEVKKISFSDAS